MRGRIRWIARCTAWAVALGALAPGALAATPTEQLAIVQTGNGGPEVLKLQTIPVLEPGNCEVLIRVYAASVNPSDWKQRIGAGAPPPAPTAASAPVDCGGMSARKAGGATEALSSVPGLDVAGVVAKVGRGVTTVKVGAPVFSMIGRSPDAGLNGAYSQYVIAPSSNVVPKPNNLTYGQAAGLGAAGITGVRSVDQAKVRAGERVLITGVAGGVGSSAAQAAIARGAHVIGTATPRHAVKNAIDYTLGDWVDKVDSVDVVIDTVGGDTALMAFNAVKKGGTFISVVSRDISPEKCAEAGIHCPAGGPPGPAASEGELLKQVAALARAGKFKVHVDRSYPLAQAAQAQEYNRTGHTEGKVVIAVTAQANQK